MKKIFCFALAVLMLLSLCACGAKEDDKLIIINENLGAEEYGVAFRADDQATCDAMQAAVAQVVASGDYAKIAEKYPDIVENLIFLQTDAPAKAEIEKSSRTFIMGIDPEYPPFSYMGDDGEYTGFDVEICKATCDLLGWDFEVFGVNWDQKLVQLDAGECDCVWSGMTILPTMTDAGYVISDPYYYNTQVLVVKESSKIATSADLKGKTVAVQLGTSGEALLAEDGDLADLSATFGKLVTCDSFLKCFTELEGGAVDAVFVDLPVAASYVNK